MAQCLGCQGGLGIGRLVWIGFETGIFRGKRHHNDGQTFDGRTDFPAEGRVGPPAMNPEGKKDERTRSGRADNGMFIVIRGSDEFDVNPDFFDPLAKHLPAPFR